MAPRATRVGNTVNLHLPREICPAISSDIANREITVTFSDMNINTKWNGQVEATGGRLANLPTFDLRNTALKFGVPDDGTGMTALEGKGAHHQHLQLRAPAQLELRLSPDGAARSEHSLCGSLGTSEGGSSMASLNSLALTGKNFHGCQQPGSHWRQLGGVACAEERRESHDRWGSSTFGTQVGQLERAVKLLRKDEERRGEENGRDDEELERLVRQSFIQRGEKLRSTAYASTHDATMEAAETA